MPARRPRRRRPAARPADTAPASRARSAAKAAATPGAARPATPSVRAIAFHAYVDRTRHPSVNLVFLMPWLFLYLVLFWTVGPEIENQAASSLRAFLRLLGRRGLFVATLLTALALCAVVLVRLRVARHDVRVFNGMFVEGLLYGLALHGAAWGLSRLLPVGSWLGIGLVRAPHGAEELRALGVAIGAGIFEELLFRGGLTWALFRILKDVVGADRWSAGAVAVVASAFVFSAYHHWGVGGEPWDAVRFTFRFHAGALLGVVFLTRGLGIAAFAHGFYDALVLLG